MTYDVAIVGGSYAGMAAGLQLAQARRRVVVVDAGQPRNRFASRSRGFLTQDGKTPKDITTSGYAELMQYDTVDWLKGEVKIITGQEGDFTLVLDRRQGESECIYTRRVILAAGVVDKLPNLPGLTERWGVHVFHCPYCHGFDLNRGKIGVLAFSESAMHLALLLTDWGDTTLFLNDSFDPDMQQLEKLNERSIHIERGSIEKLVDKGVGVGVRMVDGKIFPMDGLFIVAQTVPGPLAIRIGCELEETPLGRVVKTNAAKATSVPGVYACGDIVQPTGNISLAVSDGTLAGQAVHHSLVFGL